MKAPRPGHNQRRLRLLLMLPLAGLLLLIPSAPRAQSAREDMYVTNGPVYATAWSSTGDTLYVGGSFSHVGPGTGGGAVIDRTTGSVIPPLRRIQGDVMAVAPDGSGGWYLGGDFTLVGNAPRSRLAHLQANGTLSAWNPNANGTVSAIAVSGSTVYVAGSFTGVGGATRNRIAALDAATGAATAWDPNANNAVISLAVSGSTVYAGGVFTNVGGAARNRIAALDASSGAATSWNPNAGGSVNALVESGGTLYAGGAFLTIGGQSRSFIAALDAGTGAATAWNPSANGQVFALAVSGSTVYVGGGFSNVGGQARTYLAALSTSTGGATSWNPVANGNVYALAADGGTVYAGGLFTTLGGQTRFRIAALDASTGLATVWRSHANAEVYSLAVSGSTLYAGGNFTSVGGEMRSNAAALVASTGRATSWDPFANNIVYALAVRGSTVYAGGDFTDIGGFPRNRIAALDAVNGAATGWNPNANGRVEALVVDGSTVYAGGTFSTIGGQFRNYIAALSAATGSATSWNPNAGSQVVSLAVSGGTVYAGGAFTSIGGQPRNGIAAVSVATGSATAWNPNANGQVMTLALSGSTVYAGGSFTSIGGQSRSRLAALDATTGVSTAWNPNANGIVTALQVSGPVVYVGGWFTLLGGQSRPYLAALDPATGTLIGWEPEPNNTLETMAVSGSTVFAGGSFTTIAGQGRPYLAALESVPRWTDTTPGPLADTGQGRGAAWGDYDADGDQDLYLANLSPMNRLLRNGSFTDVTTLPLGSNPGSQGVAWADFDCDRDLDLFVSRNGTCRLFRNDGGETFADVTPGTAMEATNGSWRGVAWLDLEGDGDLDVFVANEGGGAGSKLFRNDGHTFVDGTNGALGTPGWAFGAAPADYDGDGDTDLYVTYLEAGNRLFRNDGGAWVDATSGPLGDTGNGAAAAWGDYDNDGDPDLYLSNFGGANKLFRNDGASFADATPALLTGPTASQGVAWGDLDNDGDLDLYVVASGEPARLFMNDGGGAFREAATGSLTAPGTGRGVSLGDVDQDGDLDLYITRNGEGNLLLRNEAPAWLNWLHVDLAGGRGNPSAIGERVRVVTGTLSQIREIEGGMGFLSQNSLTAEFGLGAAMEADTVEVRWRSGRVSRLTLVPANQRITIREPGVLRVPSEHPTIQAAIDAAAGGDSILVSAGTYSGAGNRDLDFGGKNLLLAYEGLVPGSWCGGDAPPLAGQVTIDAGGSGRAMYFHTGESALSVVRGFSFVNGSADFGGGVRIDGASPVFEDCVVTGNAATGQGGGVYIQGGSPSFTRSTIAGNRVDAGAGIAVDGSGALSLTQCLVWGNGQSELSVVGGSTASLTCSVVDSTGVTGSVNYVSGNTSGNPQLCGPRPYWLAPTAEGDYRPASDSPALPANNACALLMGALEEGCVLPTMVWTGEGDGSSWEDDANWSVEEPGTGDDALIFSIPPTGEILLQAPVFSSRTRPAGPLTGPVTLDSLYSEVPLRLDGGTLRVNGVAALDTLILESGSTLGGTGTFVVGVLEWRGGLMTETGTTRVTEALLLSTADTKEIRGGRTLENLGAWTWPGSGVLRHGDGALGTRLRNLAGGTLTVAGPRIMDHEPTWGAPAAFENAGTAAQTVDSTFTIEAVTTNTGTLQVPAGLLDLAGGLANFADTTLTAGRYEVADTLRFPAALVRANAAAVVLDGAASAIVNEFSADAMTALHRNLGGAELSLRNGRDLSLAALTNAGAIGLGTGCALLVTGVFEQTGGRTEMADTTSSLTAGDVRLLAGELAGSGNLTTPLFRNEGLLRITSTLDVTGDYEQTASGALEIEIGGYLPVEEYDVLHVTGTAALAGLLRVELVPPFDPGLSDAFQFLVADSVAGTFSALQSFSLATHVAYAPAAAAVVVDGKHSRFIGAPGSAWLNAANWTDGLPEATEDVLVPVSVTIQGGAATARNVRVLGSGGALTVVGGTLACDSLTVRSAGILSLTQIASALQVKTLRLEAGSLMGWTRGRVSVSGGRLEDAEGDFIVGDSPDTSFLELRNGAVMSVPGTLRIGRDLGDRGSALVEGAALDASAVEVGVGGTGVLTVLGGGVVRATSAVAPRITVGRYGTLLGTGTLIGDVKNQGLVSPGPAPARVTTTAGIGTLHCTGSYDQDATGFLEIEIAGTGTGGWDSLLVSGQAQLEGTLRLWRSHALATLPDSADVLGYGSRSGTFGAIAVQAIPQDAITVTPAYLGTALQLVLSGILVATPGPEVPRVFRVLPNFPNPFRSSTTIRFDLPAPAEATLRVYDVQGRLVRTLMDGEPVEAGVHTRLWTGEDDQGRRAASGVYFYRLEAGRDRQVRRMVKLQ